MKLALGTVQFGLKYGRFNLKKESTASEANNILDFCFRNKINTFDTAIAYGNSEQVLGAYFQNHTENSLQANVITKIPRLTDLKDLNSSQRYQYLEQLLFQSLDKIKVNQLYGILLHNPDDLILFPESADFFNQVLKSKLVQKVGVSAYTKNQIDTSIDRLKNLNLVQVPANILDQRLFEDDYLKNIKKNNIEIHVRSIFLQGLLLQEVKSLDIFFDEAKLKLFEFEEKCRNLKITKLSACINFIKEKSEVDKFVVGIDSLSQLMEIFDAYNSDISLDNYIDFKWLGDEKIINPSLWRSL